MGERGDRENLGDCLTFGGIFGDSRGYPSNPILSVSKQAPSPLVDRTNCYVTEV